MKCELCNGKGVINDADTLYGVRYCPKCDAGNLQLRLDHNFQPVVDDARPGLPEAKWKQLTPEQYVEERFTNTNPILAELPFVDVPERKLNAFIEGKPVSDDEAREYRRKHPNLMMMKMPPAVQEFNEKRAACSRCIGTGWVQVAGSTSPCPKCRRVVLSKLGGAFEFDSYSIVERDAFDNFKPGRDVA